MSLPYILGDSYELSNCTAELSTVQYYAGAKSLLVTKISTSTAEYRFVDSTAKNDMHELVTGKTYNLSAYVYLLATGSPTTGEVKLILGYTTSTGGSWNETTGNVDTEKDAWGYAETGDVVLAGAVAAKALIRINTAASTDEIIYVDNVRLQPIGIHNEHEQNFYDGGTETQYGQNSWQGILV